MKNSRYFLCKGHSQISRENPQSLSHCLLAVTSGTQQASKEKTSRCNRYLGQKLKVGQVFPSHPSPPLPWVSIHCGLFSLLAIRGLIESWQADVRYTCTMSCTRTWNGLVWRQVIDWTRASAVTGNGSGAATTNTKLSTSTYGSWQTGQSVLVNRGFVSECYCYDNWSRRWWVVEAVWVTEWNAANLKRGHMWTHTQACIHTLVPVAPDHLTEVHLRHQSHKDMRGKKRVRGERG